MSPLTTLNVPPDFERFVDALVAKYHPEKVILFGSRARGEGRTDSDVDLLVVMEHNKEANAYAASEIRTEIRARFPMDLLVRKPVDIHARLAMGDWFIRDIFREGITLYDSDRPGMD